MYIGREPEALGSLPLCTNPGCTVVVVCQGRVMQDAMARINMNLDGMKRIHFGRKMFVAKEGAVAPAGGLHFWVCLFFTVLDQTDGIPADRQSSILVPIYKNKGVCLDPANYRPLICFLCWANCKTCMYICMPNSNWSLGFRKGYSIIYNGTILSHWLRNI